MSLPDSYLVKCLDPMEVEQSSIEWGGKYMYPEFWVAFLIKSHYELPVIFSLNIGMQVYAHLGILIQ